MRFLLCVCFSLRVMAGDFPKPFNTGNDVGKSPMPAAEAVKLIKLPPGFKATVFAAEPDVQNPIACAWDSRGRLWIAENYTYAEGKTNFDKKLRDRILIFEDKDNDGHFDKRTVFADNLEKLTSIELGYGGVYATAPPYLLFIPDRDGDDKPDAPILTTERTESTEKGGKEKTPAPANASVSSVRSVVKLPGTNYEILLDGFDAWSIRHNFVNGLRWGPDGWLYGRHGIQATSHIGAPGTPAAERTPMNCGIWRFHPVRRTFEVVCWGGTNPWGLDWNAEGEGFFTNTVIGHVYHLIPGAHYERMYGEDLNPHIYQLLPQTADHYHYDRSKTWSDSRAGKANDFGGGHAHCGCMIYQGDNWPAEYRGKLFTLNLHGRRMNCERLERKGSTYVAKHEPDFAQFGDPWFRGIDLTTGPDGGVYVLDWSDDGECHEDDGVHRESGRIYKITYGEAKKPDLGKKGDLAAMSTAELMARGYIGTEWENRICLRLIAERHLSEPISEKKRKQLLDEYLAAIKTDAVNNRGYIQRGTKIVVLLTEAEVDKPPAPATPENREMINNVITHATLGGDVRTRRRFCSILKSDKVDDVLFRMQNILMLPEDNDDQVLPLLYWSTFEWLFSEKNDATVNEAAKAAYEGKIRIVLENAARRVTYDLAKRPALLDGLLALTVKSFDETKAGCITRGISAALRGAAKAPAPANWRAFAEKAAKIPALADKVRELNVIFGDGRALDEIRALALDGKADLATRRQAIESLISSSDSGLRGICEKLVGNGDLTPVAIRGLATFDDPAAAKLAVRNWDRLRADARPGVIGTLCSRPVFAQALLTAIRAGKIARENLTAYHARQIAALGDAAVSALLAEVWGEIRTTPDDKKRRIAALKTALTPDVLAKADIAKGRALYTQTCAACHTLFDLGQSGANLGPNLTGSGRANLDYLLENIVDPSAVVPADYKLSTVTLKDGRVLSGFISAKNEQTLTLRTMTENQTLPTADVTKIEGSPLSLMPDGLLDALTQEQVRDLFGFLMTK
jgi:putative membrane-bound dehydrogenase-like protein